MNAFLALISAILALTGLAVTALAPRLELVVKGFDVQAPPHGFAREGLARARELGSQHGLRVETWAVSDERDSYLDRRTRMYIDAVGGLLVLLGGSILLAGLLGSAATQQVRVSRTIGAFLILVAVLISMYAAAPYFSARSAYKKRMAARASARVDDAIKKACHSENMPLSRLFELNRRQLDEYQLLTRRQQHSTFVLAQIASVVAFVVLVTGIAIALSGSTDVEKFVGGGLSGLGSLLSAFLAATFFKSSREANKQMNRYYLEPQRTGRLLAAERLASHLDGAKESNLAAMITAVLSWEMPSDEGATGNDSLEPAASASGN